jgi:hypothetical protein
VGIRGRLVPHVSAQKAGRARNRVLGYVAGTPTLAVHHRFESLLAAEPVDLEREDESPSAANIRGAIHMVASGGARSITLCGFSDSVRLLRLGRELATDGMVIEPLIRSGGGGFDIRIRRDTSSGA